MSGVPGDADIATFGPGTRTDVTIATDKGNVGAFQFTGGNYTVTIVGKDQVFTFNDAGVQVTGGSATIEVIDSSTVQFFKSSDCGTAAYVLGRQSSLTFLFDNDNILHLGLLAGDSTRTVQLSAEGANSWSSVPIIFPPLSPAALTPPGALCPLAMGFGKIAACLHQMVDDTAALPALDALSPWYVAIIV